MPQLLDLPDGYVLRWAAIDATTGANVAGVKVQNVSVFGTNLGGGAGGSGATGPYLLIAGPAG